MTPAACAQFEVPTAENNLSVAFLVVRLPNPAAVPPPRSAGAAHVVTPAPFSPQGRCLLEVECGQCPPRAETLMSTEREPQICTLPGARTDRPLPRRHSWR